MPNYPYNLTGLQASDNLYDVIGAANSLSEGLMARLTLLVLFLIIFMALKKYESKEAFLTASYITAVISILFRLMGFISNSTMFVCFLLVGVGFVWIRMSD